MSRTTRFVIAAALALSGCRTASLRVVGPTEPAPPPELTPAPPPPPAEVSFDVASETPPKPLLTLGLSRPVGKAVAEASQVGITAYLMQELGGDTATRVFDDGDALAKALVSGEIEAAWLTPVAYVRASGKTALKPIVKMSRDGFGNYRSVFFVKKGSKVKKLADLKGKKAAFVARASASGRLFPMAHLKKQGKDPAKFFSKMLDLADHREVCLAVLEGRADVGVTLSDEVKDGVKPIPDGCREAKLDETKLVVIDRTDAIPNDVIAFRADVPDAIVTRVQEALVRLGQTPEGVKQISEIFQADGFTSANDADFTIVREMEAATPPK